MAIIRDTEFTSWEWCHENGWDHEKGQYREIIQIGAVKIEGSKIIEENLRYVLPLKNPQLSWYIQKLTGITQDTLQREGEWFTEIYTHLLQWWADHSWYSYGKDREVLRETAQIHNIDVSSSFFSSCYDIRPIFEKIYEGLWKATSGTAHKVIWLSDRYFEHDALWDAKNIARVVKHLNIVL